MIDWTRIQELEEEVGPDDFAEIAKLFLDEVGETLKGLPHIPPPGNRGDVFHGLKGSAMNLGFAEVARLCVMAEADPANADLSAIRAAFDAARALLEDRFPDLAG